MDADGGESGSAPDTSPSGERDPEQPGRGPQQTWSWLGCLWIVIIPCVLLGVVVVTLNWLGC